MNPINNAAETFIQVFHRATTSRRASSVGSTIAELLNETFDSEDSELKNLDWEEWEDDIHYDITEEDFPGMNFFSVFFVYFFVDFE